MRANVPAFAVQTCRDPDSYGMLDLGQWDFWVAPAHVIAEAGARSVGLSFLRKRAAGPLAWPLLAKAVAEAAAKEAAAAGSRA